MGSESTMGYQGPNPTHSHMESMSSYCRALRYLPGLIFIFFAMLGVNSGPCSRKESAVSLITSLNGLFYV